MKDFSKLAQYWSQDESSVDTGLIDDIRVYDRAVSPYVT